MLSEYSFPKISPKLITSSYKFALEETLDMWTDSFAKQTYSQVLAKFFVN